MVADIASMGLEVSKRETPGHPMVVAHGGEGGPHLLFYGHYDVQPVDPLDLWDRDPFDAAVVDGEITEVDLAAYRGKWTVLLFYPKDFTFGRFPSSCCFGISSS